MDLTRRPATAFDIGFARQVHHRAYRDVVERQFGPWVEDDQDRYFARNWAIGGYEILLCDGTACGYVSLEDRTDDVYVRELVLLPEFQGRGIGSAVLHEVTERAHSLRLPVRLQVLHKNRAITLYRRLGFREIGRTETHTILEW